MKKLIACILAFAMLFALSVTGFAVDLLDYKADTIAVIVLEDETLEFPSLEEAFADAEPGDTVNLVKEYTIEKNIEIPKEVTLTVPTSAALTDTENGKNDKASAVAGTPYMILHIAKDAILSVSGTLLVAGNQQGGMGKTGFLYGDYGKVDLEGTIEVNDGGTLYARGEVSGNGTVTVKEGGSVYQRFEISDWRGGTASLSAYDNRDNPVYPFNLYEARGLEVKTTYNYGAALYGQAYIYSDRLGRGAISTVQMLGYEGLIAFDRTTPTSTVTFSRDENDISTAEVTGSVSTGDIVVYIELFFGIDIPLKSSNAVGPFGYKQNVTLKNGATFNVTNELKVLPDCVITVEPNATMNVSKGMYFYTVNGYSGTYNYANWNGTNDATLVVQTIDGVSGKVTGPIGSTSETLDNITGLGVLTKDGTYVVNEVTQSGSTVTLAPVTFNMTTVA